MSVKIRFDIAGKTDPGCVRENNEDSMGVDEGLGLLIVADGMGGHNAGEVASRIAVEEILKFARAMMGGPKQLLPEGGDPAKSPHARLLDYFVTTANTMIFEKAKAFPEDHGMGTTVVAVLLGDGAATVAHVGDSRLYLFRNGRLEVLTQDHSLVMEHVKRGLMTSEQADKSHLQNILTRALGTEAEVKVDIEEHPVLAGDVLLLCTDGLTKMVSEADVAGVLREGGPLPAACDRLVEMARAAGGLDNVTVAMARAGKGGGVRGVLGRIFGKG